MIAEILEKYFNIFPEDRAKLALLCDQVVDGERLNTRKNFRGHVTGGAVVLSPDKSKILLIHHNLFNRWLQPGGHWDPEDASPLDAARREAIEETSVIIDRLLPVFDDPTIPLDIDTHAIMARPDRNEPAHYHHDFRYVFLAKDEALNYKESEVSASAWVPFDDPRAEHVQTLIKKLRKFGLVTKKS